MTSLERLSNRELKLQRARAAIELCRRRSRESGGFDFFIHHVFPLSFDNFIAGQYIHDIATHMQAEPWTMDVTGRDMFKSTRFYAEIMWLIFASESDVECHYFSYNTDLARYHLEKIKTMIARNPFFKTVQDNKEMADSVMDYYNGKARVTVQPAGLLSFKRGIHADAIYIDDPLRDPENKLKPTVINKINRVISMEIFAMVNKGGRCRIVGTPQTYDDFFFNDDLQKKTPTGKGWDIRIMDSIVDEATQTVLWEEWRNFDELMQIRATIGEKAFEQEYRCKPAYAADSYIGREPLLLCVDPALQNIKLQAYETENVMLGGFDIGKHTHPSHLAVFERYFEDGALHYRQVLSKWMDGWTYTDQIEYLTMVCDLLNIQVLRYDNTRGEFESFDEQGKLPKAMKPTNLIGKQRHGMAANLDTLISNRRITLVNDKRQTEQILAVNNDLEAMETADGHGDSFWSVCLAVVEDKVREFAVRSI